MKIIEDKLLSHRAELEEWKKKGVDLND